MLKDHENDTNLFIDQHPLKDVCILRIELTANLVRSVVAASSFPGDVRPSGEWWNYVTAHARWLKAFITEEPTTKNAEVPTVDVFVDPFEQWVRAFAENDLDNMKITLYQTELLQALFPCIAHFPLALSTFEQLTVQQEFSVQGAAKMLLNSQWLMSEQYVSRARLLASAACAEHPIRSLVLQAELDDLLKIFCVLSNFYLAQNMLFSGNTNFQLDGIYTLTIQRLVHGILMAKQDAVFYITTMILALFRVGRTSLDEFSVVISIIRELMSFQLFSFFFSELLLQLMDEKSEGPSIHLRATVLSRLFPARTTSTQWCFDTFCETMDFNSAKVQKLQEVLDYSLLSGTFCTRMRPFRYHPGIGVGWRNTGNTCFIAACVNTLFLTTPALTAISRDLQSFFDPPCSPLFDFVTYDLISSLSAAKHTMVPAELRNGFAFCEEMLRCLVQAHLSDRDILNLTQLTQLCPISSGASQEDVCELLLWILNFFDALTQTRADQRESELTKMFRINLTAELSCSLCHRKRRLHETSFTLLLPWAESDELQSNGIEPSRISSSTALSKKWDSLQDLSSLARPPDESPPSSSTTTIVNLQSETSSVTTRDSSLSELSTQAEEVINAIDQQPMINEDASTAEEVEETSSIDTSITVVLDCAEMNRTIGLREHSTSNIEDLFLGERKYKETNRTHSVAELIDCYLRTERLCDYRCDSDDGCGSVGFSNKRMMFCDLPEVLVVTLARFQQILGRLYKIGSPIRIDKCLAIPAFIDYTDPMTAVSSESLQDARPSDGIIDYGMYELYVAIIHSGRDLDSGHYNVIGRPMTAQQTVEEADESTRRSSKDDFWWYLLDDHEVAYSSFAQLQEMAMSTLHTPYVLCYRKVHTRFDNMSATEASQPPCLGPLLEGTCSASSSSAHESSSNDQTCRSKSHYRSDAMPPPIGADDLPTLIDAISHKRKCRDGLARSKINLIDDGTVATNSDLGDFGSYSSKDVTTDRCGPENPPSSSEGTRHGLQSSTCSGGPTPIFPQLRTRSPTAPPVTDLTPIEVLMPLILVLSTVINNMTMHGLD